MTTGMEEEDIVAQQQQHQRRIKWATRLEEVLNDFDALQLFQSWMGVDDDSSEHPLRLHFAIVAYQEMLARQDARAGQLAREIYNKFLRPCKGLCDFIELPVRERIGQKLRQHQQHQQQQQKQQKQTPPPLNLFNECLPPLDTFLRKQHALFVTSDEFLEKFNAISTIALGNDANDGPCCSTTSFAAPGTAPIMNSAQQQQSIKTPVRRLKRLGQQQQQALLPQTSSSASARTLTADTLFRSQKDREAVVPDGVASQRLFKPVSKFPYVGQAQPSKNDSAVSSAISSEANNKGGGKGITGHQQQHSFQPHHQHHHQGASLRMMREEQRRINPPTGSTFPRLEFGPMPDPNNPQKQQPPPPPESQVDHGTPVGRQKFADQLQRKLREIERRHQQEESVNEQIDKLARKKDSKTTARELIAQPGANDTMLLLEEESAAAAGMEADEDLDIYCRRKMAVNDSNSSAPNSAQQSPLMPLSRRTAARQHSWRHRSGSPSTERVPQLEWTSAAPATTMGTAVEFDQPGPGTARLGGPAANTANAVSAMMSQSCCIVNPSSAVTGGSSSLFMMSGRAPMMPSFPAPTAAAASAFNSQYPLLDSAERTFLPFPPSHFQQQQHSAFANLFSPFPGPSPLFANSGANSSQFGQPQHQLHHQHPLQQQQQEQQQPIPPAMCQSMHLGGIGTAVPLNNAGYFSPHSSNTMAKQMAASKFPFGMPPQPANRQQSATTAYGCDNDGDTSGIGSMTSATHSGTSAPGTVEHRERQRAAVFRKARELSSGGGGGERAAAAGPGNGGSGAATRIIGPSEQQQQSGIPRQKRTSGIAGAGGQTNNQQQQQLQFMDGQINRPSPCCITAAALPFAPSYLQQQQQPQQPDPMAPAKMTISYRDNNSGDGVPVVAHVPARPLTFREFRRHLSISNKDRRQFFFKVACEDGSAPYQWLLVNDNSALVPQFQGKVTAECRAPLSDSD